MFDSQQAGVLQMIVGTSARVMLMTLFALMGTTVIGTIQHTTTDQIVVSFSSAFAGKAFIS